MPESIHLQPALPPPLREAALRGVLVPFIGGGVSALAGSPTWQQLADAALRCCVDGTVLTHAQLDQLQKLNARRKLSIARAIAAEHDIPIDYEALLHPRHEDPQKGRTLYASLQRLSTRFVTTNYDKWLDVVRPPHPSTIHEPPFASDSPPSNPHVVFRKSDLTADALNRENVVVHLHGSVAQPEDMVLTTSDYVRHYQNDRSGTENPVLTFLANLFRNKCVLFLGYGLDELEILEYIILNSSEFMTQGMAPRHYLVQGFFSHEHGLMRHLRTYYQQCGVGLNSIPQG